MIKSGMLAIICGLIVAVIIAGVLVVLPVFSADNPQVKLKKVPITASTTIDGKELFATYCAVCHGTDGKGQGPAVSALKVPPPDLTRISERSGGTFPGIRVLRSIRGEDQLAAHGSHDMPIWGPVFRSVNRSATQMETIRSNNLVEYIKSIQAK